MFVKLVFRDGRESLYQCDRFYIRPAHGSTTHSDVDCESNHPLGSISIGEVDRREVSFYVMNDAGKTIEAYTNCDSLQHHPNGLDKVGQTSGVPVTAAAL